MFRPLLLAGMVMGALAGAASAADIGGPPAPSGYVPAVVPAPYYDWTGVYLGGNIGTAWVFHDGATTTTSTGTSFATPTGHAFWGLAGGGQVGANWFFVPNFMIGAEGDFAALTNKNTVALTDGSTEAEHPEFVSTARARFGLTADRFVWYATAGAAWSDDRITRTQVTAALNAPPVGTVETVTHRGTGFVVGTGLEYALASHVTTRLEFLYVGLGNETYTFPVAARSTTATFDTIGLVRFGLNFKLGGGDAQLPIRARD